VLIVWPTRLVEAVNVAASAPFKPIDGGGGRLEQIALDAGKWPGNLC